MTLRALTAADILTPGPGEVLEAVSGDVLVFAQQGEGPRCPVMTLRPGDWAVGASASGDVRLFFTGLPGTHVRELSLDEALASKGEALLSEWIYRLSSAGRGERWADRVIAPMGTALRCAPGENVSSGTDAVPLADRSIQGWLQVTSGSARWCGVAGADIGVLDPPLPVTRGVWVTSGLRCRIADAEPPDGPAAWQAAIDLVTRCASQAAVEREQASSQDRVRRLSMRQEQAQAEALEAVDLLAGAVVGPIVRVSSTGSAREASFAAAEIVLRASGIEVPDEARDLAWREVESGRLLSEAMAQACTARARTIDLPARWWEAEGPPLLGSRRTGEPVALLSRPAGRVLVDPAVPGVETAVDDEIAAAVSGRATEFVAVLPAQPQNVRGLLRLGSLGSRSDLIVIAVLTVVIGLASFVTPVVFGAITASFGTLSVANLLVLLGVLAIVLAATTAWRYVRSLALLRVRIRGIAVAEGAVWDRLMRLRANWHEARTLGERMMQASAVTLAAMSVPDAVILALLDSFAVLGSLGAVATTNGMLLATLVGLLVVQVLLGLLLDRAVATRVRARVRAASAANGRLIETLRAVNRLRISGAESRALRRWAYLQAAYVRSDVSLRRIALLQGLLLSLWPLVTIIAMVAVTAASGASYADFITAQTAAAIATGAISAALMAVNALLSARATLRELDDVLAAEPEGRGSGARPGRLQGGLSVQDLVFRYTPTGPAVLDGVSFDVSPGEHVAIVGGSGCGKTTLMRVLLGLEDPLSGTITVDGRDLSSLDQPSVRRQIGCVLQSSSLLPGTIIDNVDMGRGLTRPEIWAALDAAAVGDDVRAMAMGLDTPVVDGGGTVSGGQRQRILIARAVAGNPRMVILDEATSALDNITQGVVVQTFDRLRLTRLVVAHRLSTIRRADRILVLDKGQVVEEGTFDDLMAVNGIFAELARRQLA